MFFCFTILLSLQKTRCPPPAPFSRNASPFSLSIAPASRLADLKNFLAPAKGRGQTRLSPPLCGWIFSIHRSAPFATDFLHLSICAFCVRPPLHTVLPTDPAKRLTPAERFFRPIEKIIVKFSKIYRAISVNSSCDFASEQGTVAKGDSYGLFRRLSCSRLAEKTAGRRRHMPCVGGALLANRLKYDRPSPNRRDRTQFRACV